MTRTGISIAKGEITAYEIDIPARWAEFKICDSRIEGSLTLVMEGVPLGGNIFQRIADAWSVLRKKEVARPIQISDCVFTGEDGIIIIKTGKDPAGV